MDATTPPASRQSSELIRRVLRALVAADDVVSMIEHAGNAPAPTEDERAIGRIADKAIAEAAMLLVCVEPARYMDRAIDQRAAALALRLAPHARSERVRTTICLTPALALEHGGAHVILSALGHPDASVDALLRDCLRIAPDFGPERLPYRRLEREWLCHLWPAINTHGGAGGSSAIADSMLARPLDVLGGTRDDFYAFTHALMYATAFGARRIDVPRSLEELTADVDDALAWSLARNDYDLTAELLLTWTLLDPAPHWSPAAAFAFNVVASVEDELSFVPGMHFEREQYESRTDAARRRSYALRTSYHTMLVMGFLCATALAGGRLPPAWTALSSEPDAGQQDTLARFALAGALQTAAEQGDLGAIRRALETALALDICDTPAARQAGLLLRRCLRFAASAASAGPKTGGYTTR